MKERPCVQLQKETMTPDKICYCVQEYLTKDISDGASQQLVADPPRTSGFGLGLLALHQVLRELSSPYTIQAPLASTYPFDSLLFDHTVLGRNYPLQCSPFPVYNLLPCLCLPT